MFLFALLILTSRMDRQTAVTRCCQHGCRGQLGCAEQEMFVLPMFSPEWLSSSIPVQLKSLMFVKPGWKQTQTTTVYKMIWSLQTAFLFFPLLVKQLVSYYPLFSQAENNKLDNSNPLGRAVTRSASLMGKVSRVSLRLSVCLSVGMNL